MDPKAVAKDTRLVARNIRVAARDMCMVAIGLMVVLFVLFDTCGYYTFNHVWRLASRLRHYSSVDFCATFSVSVAIFCVRAIATLIKSTLRRLESVMRR